MANRKQLAILKQGVSAWNKWREENPDAKIDLRGAKLDGMDLSGANFSKADIRGVIFNYSRLIQANFSHAIIGTDHEAMSYITSSYITSFRGADLNCAIFDNSTIENIDILDAITDYSSWKDIKETHNYSPYFLFENTILYDDQIHALLVSGSGRELSIEGKNLKRTRLVNFDLRGTDLRETNLLQADLSGADITGAKLWGSARENWIIDGIRCEYVYLDEAGEERTPPDRDFRPGEFEELYKQLPSFEYVFAQGFTPLDPLIMDRVVQAINEQHKEFSLKLVNFDKRGEPHATFTVCRLDYVDAARKQIEEGYERNKIAPERQEPYLQIISRLLDQNDKSLDIIKQLGGTAIMGDTYNIHGGQIGAVGQSASASGNIFQQITPELSRVHEEMQRSAKTPEQRAAAEEVAKAEQAARQQNEPTMRQHLKNAGKFAVDCAKTIGTDVAAEYLKKITLGG